MGGRGRPLGRERESAGLLSRARTDLTLPGVKRKKSPEYTLMPLCSMQRYPQKPRHERPQGRRRDERRKKRSHAQAAEYYSARKKEEIVTFVTPSMKLEKQSRQSKTPYDAESRRPEAGGAGWAKRVQMKMVERHEIPAVKEISSGDVMNSTVTRANSTGLYI